MEIWRNIMFNAYRITHNQVRSDVGAYTGAVCRHVNPARILFQPPFGHCAGRRQARPCPYFSDRTPPDATTKRAGGFSARYNATNDHTLATGDEKAH